MSSVQVRILQSGRTDAYSLPLVPGSVATVDRSLAVSLVYSGFASWMNPEDAYDGQTNIGKPSESYTLFQSGIPFWMPPGDGGANGLSFTGTRGVFTLSAAAPMQYSVAFTKGCYCYLPAGSGGLVNGGLYWCQMSDDTNGEVFAETYSGTGQPAFISSPTALPHMTAGRITQITSEVTMVNGTIPANSMGPNGIFRALFAVRATNSATTKTGRVKIGANTMGIASATTSGCVADIESIFQNAGVVSRNTKPTGNIGRLHSATTSMNSGDVMTQDTSVDAPFSFTMTIGATTDSVIGVLRKVSVEYGA